MAEPDDFEIVAQPSLRVVTTGAHITYRLKPRKPTSPSLSSLGYQWFAVNDPKSVTWYRPNTVSGPLGRSAWEDASWSFEGVHHVVCRVGDQGRFTDFSFEQHVASLQSTIAIGPQLRFHAQDPEAVLDASTRKLDLITKFTEQHPPGNDDLRKKNDEQIARLRDYRDRLASRLLSTKGKQRFAVQAEHLDAATQQRTQLLVFAVQMSPTEWKLVDWTNPADQRTTGEYSGTGANSREALKAAFADWDSGNRYPDGGISYRIDDAPDVGALQFSFETDGGNFWDSVSTFFTYVGIAAAVVAGVVTLVAPVPGSQLVSAAIWTSIFSSSAAATINISQRAQEGFSSFRANAFDVLTIGANILGAFGMVWARGALIAAEGAEAAQLARIGMKVVLIGQVTTDSVQGVLLSVESADEIKRISDDPNLTPADKVDRILEIIRKLAIAGTLLYINAKGTKADLENLSRPSKLGGPSPADRLKSLGDPNATVELKVPKVEGHTQEPTHTTKVQIDQEAAPPHVTGRAEPAATPPKKPAPPQGLQKTADLEQLFREAPAAHAELERLTKEVAAKHGGRPDVPSELKSLKRSRQKVATDYGGDASQLLDIARSTIVFKTPGELRAALRDLESRGMVKRVKDRFAKPVNGYRDMLINIEMSNGHVVEMQLHLEAILKVKNGPGHALYDQARQIRADAKTQGRGLTAAETAEIERLEAESKALYDAAFAEASKGN